MKLEESIKKLLNTSQQATINNMRNLFKEEAYDELFNKYEEILYLSDIWKDDKAFEASIEDEEVDINTLLIWYLASEDVLLQLDWSGEEDDGQVVDFVNSKLQHSYKLDLELDASNIYEMFEKGEYNNAPIKRGQHLEIMFIELNKQLLKEHLEIVSYNTESDEYYIGVLEQEVIEKLMGCDYNNVEIELFR